MHRLRERIGVLEGDFDFVLAIGVLLGGRDLLHMHHVRSQQLALAVDVRHESLQAFGVVIGFLLAGALVFQRDRHTARAHQVRQLAQARGHARPVDLRGGEDLRVRLPAHGRAATVAGTQLLELLLRVTTLKADAPGFAVALDNDLKPFGKRVHTRHAYAVQTTGHLVGVLVELATGVQLGQRHFDSGLLLGRVHVDRNAAAVIAHGHATISTQGDPAVARMTGQRLVHRVVDHFPDEVVQTAHIGVADVHRGAHAYGLKAFEDCDRLCVVGLRLSF